MDGIVVIVPRDAEDVLAAYEADGAHTVAVTGTDGLVDKWVRGIDHLLTGDPMMRKLRGGLPRFVSLSDDWYDPFWLKRPMVELGERVTG